MHAFILYLVANGFPNPADLPRWVDVCPWRDWYNKQLSKEDADEQEDDVVAVVEDE